MIKYYKPSDKNTHVVKISFNHEGFCGYITIPCGHPVKGADIISFGINFLKNCNENDILSITDNNCDLYYIVETNCFAMNLKNNSGLIRKFRALSPSELLNIIVGIEIIECKRV